MARPRPMGVSKVPSAYFGNREEFRKISKAAWADLYFDLYAQSSGRCDDVTAEEVINDAIKRLKTLKANGIR